MKSGRGEVRKRGLLVLAVLLVVLLCAFPAVYAQDMVVTNLSDLAQQAFSGEHSIYLPGFTPWEWQAYSLDGDQPWWIDCSQLSCPELLEATTDIQYYGVQLAAVVLTKNVLTGEVTLQPYGMTNVVAVISPPSGYQPGALSEDRGVWSMWQDATQCPDCWGIEGGFPPPVVVLTVLLADVNGYATYESNVEAQAEAEAATEAATASAASMSGRFIPMDDEDPGDGGGDPCSITNLTQPFNITGITQGTNGTTITWQSCQMFRYAVLSADVLSTNTAWAAQSYTSYVWGRPNASSTTWTDTTATAGVTQRFYKVERMNASPIAAGGQHSLALTADGKLWSWGYNGDGQLGDGVDPYNVEFSRSYPGEVADPTSCFGQTISNAVALAAGGDEFTVVADANGIVWTCGDDEEGELGRGSLPDDDQNDSFPPTPVSGVNNVVSVAAGAFHTLALRADGAVFAWGDDSDTDGNPGGQLGVGGLAAGYTRSPTQSLALTQIVAIAAGSYHSVALDITGTVWTCGEGDSGQLGNGGAINVAVPTALTTISNVTAIAAGALHTVALTADKTLWAWGDNSRGQLGNSSTTNVLTPAPVFSNVVAIAGGPYFTLAVTSNGYVYGWGDNAGGQLGTNSSAVAFTNRPMLVAGLSNAVWVSAPVSACTEENGCAHRSHSMAMTVDGGTNRYWGWGYNYSGEVGNGTNHNNNVSGDDNVYTPVQPQFCTRCQREIQLGTNGTFTAQCNGTLYLYFNDDQTAFSDNSGSFTAAVGSFAPVGVYANNVSGVAVGAVTNGGVYSYTASGTCFHCQIGDGCPSDPNGTNPDTTNLWNCSDFTVINATNSVCPTAECFSLVGKIQ